MIIVYYDSGQQLIKMYAVVMKSVSILEPTSFTLYVATDVHVGLDMGWLVQECQLKQGLSQKDLTAVRLASSHPACNWFHLQFALVRGSTGWSPAEAYLEDEGLAAFPTQPQLAGRMATCPPGRFLLASITKMFPSQPHTQ